MSTASESITAKNIPIIFLPWIVWLLGCVFYFYEFLLQVSPSVIGTELMRDFSITGQTLVFYLDFIITRILPCNYPAEY